MRLRYDPKSGNRRERRLETYIGNAMLAVPAPAVTQATLERPSRTAVLRRKGLGAKARGLSGR